MNGNPFSTMFGRVPYVVVPRENNINEITSDFLSGIPSSNLYIIIGARGSGKTVLLTELYNFFDEKDDWIVADVNPHRNILENLASSLYEKGKMRHLFLRGSFDFSFSGISFRIEGKEPVSNTFSMVDKMLAYLSKHGKKF